MLEKTTGRAAGSIGHEDEQVSRRDVLKTAAASAGVLIALPMLASTAHADGTPAAPTPPKDDWRPAGDLTTFKQNQPVRVDLGVTVAWVTRLDARKFDSVSAHCTHHGCILGYDPQTASLVCPCHGGTFKIDGVCLAGTRRRPEELLPHLRTLPVRVKGGQVQVNVASVE